MYVWKLMYVCWRNEPKVVYRSSFLLSRLPTCFSFSRSTAPYFTFCPSALPAQKRGGMGAHYCFWNWALRTDVTPLPLLMMMIAGKIRRHSLSGSSLALSSRKSGGSRNWWYVVIFPLASPFLSISCPPYLVLHRRKPAPQIQLGRLGSVV